MWTEYKADYAKRRAAESLIASRSRARIVASSKSANAPQLFAIGLLLLLSTYIANAALTAMG